VFSQNHEIGDQEPSLHWKLIKISKQFESFLENVKGFKRCLAKNIRFYGEDGEVRIYIS